MAERCGRAVRDFVQLNEAIEQKQRSAIQRSKNSAGAAPPDLESGLNDPSRALLGPKPAPQQHAQAQEQEEFEFLPCNYFCSHPVLVRRSDTV